MFPIRDDNPTFLKPVVTVALIGANVLMWVAVQGLGAEPGLSRSICSLGLIPADLFNQFPQRGPVPCPLDGSPNWHTVLTSMFLHGGWMHLIGNMWFLWIFGNNVEDSMGHGRFLAFYLLCGLAAAAAQSLADPDSAIPMVGASGAIGGVMGAYIVLYPRVHVHMLIFLGFFVTTFAVPAVWMLGYWLLIQVLGGFMSQGGGGVAFWAHIGGFVAGGLLIFLFKNNRLLQRHPYYGWKRQVMPTRSWRKVR
ncbi:MAG: rhomboid family intramembrane serine protease [Xanthomonadales bacterium]|nr:rhomboid family intramembrane serine protease [Xanthomonadales bacterium]